MEEKNITIEIRQEVAVMLVFIVAGIIFVSAAFTIPLKSPELWPALNAGGIAAGIYLAALLVYVLREPLPMRTRIVAGVIGLVAMIAVTFTWIRNEDRTRWQADLIVKICATIGRNIFSTAMPEYLLKTLDEYHQQKPHQKEFLGDIFRRLHNNPSVGSNIHTQSYPNDPIRVFIKTLDRDLIVLVGQETYAKGRDLSFRNYDGKIGMVQERYTLTEKGMIHESEN